MRYSKMVPLELLSFADLNLKLLTGQGQLGLPSWLPLFNPHTAVTVETEGQVQRCE